MKLYLTFFTLVHSLVKHGGPPVPQRLPPEERKHLLCSLTNCLLYSVSKGVEIREKRTHVHGIKNHSSKDLEEDLQKKTSSTSERPSVGLYNCST